MSNNVLFVGDLHGNIRGLYDLFHNLNQKGTRISEIYCVGDTDLYPDKETAKKEAKNYDKYNQFITEYLEKGLPRFPIPVNIITGNNDYLPFLRSTKAIGHNLIYRPTGSVSWIDPQTPLININGIHSKNAFPQPREQVEYKYYVESEINKIKRTADYLNKICSSIIMLGHIGSYGHIKHQRAKNEGSMEISKLINYTKSSMYIHGHHHVNYINKEDPEHINTDMKTTYIGLGNFAYNQSSYFLLERA